MGNPSAAIGQEVSERERPTSANGPEADASLCLHSTGQQPSLSDFAEQVGCLLNEQRDLTLRLSKALDENAALNQLHKQACANFDDERIRLTSEIANLRSQLNNRLRCILATKENLI